MNAQVRDLKIDSGNDYATVTIVVSRSYVAYTPQAADLPDDVKAALLRWLGVQP